MMSSGWDSVIGEYDDKFVIVKSLSNRAVFPDGRQIGRDADLCFPFIPSKWMNIVGHLSGHMCYDTWITDVARGLNILVDDLRFQIFHYVIYNDEEGIEKKRVVEEQYGKSVGHVGRFYDDDMTKARHVDAQKIISSGVLG